MKKFVLLFVLAGFFVELSGQNSGVEKSVMGIQIGFLGVWFHKEQKLSDALALRGEVGFDSGIWGGKYYDKTNFVMAPVITLEPRWYYNLSKRSIKNKEVKDNSGNYLSLKTSYHPDWFVISNARNVSVISDISIIPMWGIRRNIGRHFNYELGFGVGYRYFFAKEAGYSSNDSEFDIGLQLRIGYRF